MSLTILKDDEIAELLNYLTFDELESFRSVLKQALYEYSTGTQSVQDGDIQQPPRTSVTSPVTGCTTLFMPSCSTEGLGMKARKDTLPPPVGTQAKANIRPTGALTLYSETGNPIGILHASTLTAFRTALASACLLQRRDTVKNITVFGCGEQAYWHVRLALLLRGDTIRHVNIISRRFDSSRAFVARFYKMATAVKEREGWASDTKFSILTTGYNDYERLLSENLRSSDVIFCCTPSTEPLFDHRVLTNHEGRRRGRLIVAIGSYTHEMRELPAELLRQATKTPDKTHVHYHKHAVEGGVVVVDTLDGALKEAGEIAEAGLGPRHLVELGELVMLSRVALLDDDSSEDIQSLSSASTFSATSSEFEKLSLNGPAMSSVYGSSQDTMPKITTSHAPSTADALASPTTPTVASGGGSNSRSASPARKGSGGLLSSLTPRHHRRSSSQASVDRRKKKEDQSARWLQRGNVIYKSVGLGLMDLSVGLRLIDFAREKGVGTRVPGF
ncbi:ornithine cyclodeaminase [Sporothrix brasiliensis 5110]|uniref:Ornithine cyclodeaminase n=1 Tax=Sporothrix brasiliensis 5110 TaxID=1398154 RepID=A0A0C2J5D6_9PEZI|nr:ornithine cyclodeaminase [Sporothrix brasiliensis 5110]KIH94190.1 ornithine cyclodeaminase [Sporothrix brasiliensis 5110]